MPTTNTIPYSGTSTNTSCMTVYGTFKIVLISVLVLVFQVVGKLYLVLVFRFRTNIHRRIIMSIHNLAKSIIVLALVLASILDKHSYSKSRS